MSIQKEDVYETEDLPEDDQNMQREEILDSEEVERMHLNVEAALQHFKGRLVNADGVDFSDSIARRRRAGYGSGAYVLEVVGRECEQPETVEQRFHRLNYELNELAEMLLSEGTEKEKIPNVTCETLIQMQETLKAMQLKKSTAEPVVPRPQNQVTRSDAAGSVNPRLVALESRLNRVEQFVGAGLSSEGDVPGEGASRGPPLADAVEDLRMRVHSLNPSHVDALHSRLTQVLAKFDQVESKRLERVESDFEDKVNALYAMMTKWDEICVGLPSVVQRMHGLQKLHEQAQQFSSRLSHLAGVRTQLLKTIEGEEMAALDFREQTARSLDAITVGMKKLDERLQKLSTK